MFRVLNCLGDEHDLRLVVLAGLICFVASVVAISLFCRATATEGHVRTAWLALAGVATGCGIWATHFIAMLAYEPGVPVAYDFRLTMLRSSWRLPSPAAVWAWRCIVNRAGCR